MEEKRDSLVNDGQGEGNESKKGKRKGRGRGRGRKRGAVLTWFRGVLLGESRHSRPGGRRFGRGEEGHNAGLGIEDDVSVSHPSFLRHT